MRGVVACAVLGTLLAGCGSDAKSGYTSADVKSAYFRASDESKAARPLVQDYWADPNSHEHTNFVPGEGIETCPQAQRANANADLKGNFVLPSAGQPVNQFVVAPKASPLNA